MTLRWLFIITVCGVVSAYRIERFTNLITARYPLEILRQRDFALDLRGGDQAPILDVDSDEEKVEEKVAFVTNKSDVNGIKETQSSRLSNEINKNLRDRFADASLSLQRLVELQKFKPMAMNFSNEIKARYGETVSKLYKLKLASIVKTQRIQEKIKQQCDAHLNYDTISQSMGTAKNWMKEGTIGAVSNDATGYILLATYMLSSLGSSLGFVSFLYFVSVGFGASIGIIAASALILSNFYSKNTVPLPTNIHTGLALLWSLRLIMFLLHREYINWPQWHDKLSEVDERANTQSRITIWMTCSLFYSMMMAPCINRMKEATIGTNVSKWGNAGKTGICMQGGGLLLETVADLQKGQFKRISGNRNRFCNVGVWNFFSHPNYLGEMVFWVGTFLGGVACNNTMSDWSISIAGLLFILTVMKGACDSLDSKHIKNYGHDEEYLGFRKKRCFVGPVPSILQRGRKLSNVQQYNLPIK